ncbi:MAG: DUF2784 domain-containing protein [Actinomycetes bacterium]|jgi:hypothetical protein|uniref:Unannotated protein n=1 Tax=freshwater metagenome TaxID=449393 RepID=A0A6J6D186_9ZZZZ
MSAGLLADVVVVIHFGFVLFVVFGGLLAIWRPKVMWAHVPAALYGLVVVTVGVTCPLTTVERDLRERAGEERYRESFIERYVEGVLYPGDMLREAQAAGVLVVIASWLAVAGRARRRRPAVAA